MSVAVLCRVDVFAFARSVLRRPVEEDDGSGGPTTARKSLNTRPGYDRHDKERVVQTKESRSMSKKRKSICRTGASCDRALKNRLLPKFQLS